jgi:hypothetical protein
VNSPPTQSSNRSFPIVVAVLVFFHIAAADLFLFWQPSFVIDSRDNWMVSRSGAFEMQELYEMARLGFFAAETSLIALCADRFPARSYFRIPLALLVVLGICWISSGDWQKHGFQRFAENCCLLGTTALLLIGGFSALRLKRAIFPGDRPADAPSPPAPFQFSIGTILIWTTVVAVFFGLGRLAVTDPRWISHEHAMLFVERGAYCAIFSALVFLAVIETKSRWPLVPVIWLIYFLAFIEAFGFSIQGNPAATRHICAAYLTLATVQLLTLLLTLLPLRRCGLFAKS